MNMDYMDMHVHVILLLQSGPLSSKIYSLVEPSQGRITLGYSGVSELAMEQKRGLPQNNTNIHFLLFNSPV